MATELSIIGTAATSWADAFRAIRAMPLVAGIALVLMIVLSLATFALAPLSIAVHRYVLLGELTSRYPFDRPRYVRYVGFTILVWCLFLIPVVSGLLAVVAMALQVTAAAWLLSLIAVATVFAVIIVANRRVILFPAIAIDAPGTTWSNARQDTIGSSWRVFFILFCTALLGVIIIVVLSLLLLALVYLAGFSRQGPAGMIVNSIVQIPMVCAFAAAAAHIFRARADRLTRPVEPQAAVSLSRPAQP
jgi:hypothetical protein